MKRLLLALLVAPAILLTAASQAETRSAGDAALSPAEKIFGVKQLMSCGLPPLPPLGCRVGPCTCDASGNNCQWTFICS